MTLCAAANAGAGSRLAIPEFEYFPGHVADQPPPLEAIGPERSSGVIHVPGAGREARWLRGRFELDARPDSVQTLYVSAANRGVRAFVNGVEIGSTSISDAERFGWNYPLFFTIPPALLHAGRNTLDLHLALTTNGWGSLRDVELGAHATLKPLYDRVLFWRVTGPQITSLIAVLTAAVALLVWFRRRTETVFAWFALTCLMAAIRNAHFYVAAPITERWYEVWAAVPLHWMSAALALFSLRLCGQRYPRIEATLLWAALGWSIAIALAGTRYTRVAVDLGYLWLFLVNVGILAYVLARCLKRPKVDRILLLVAVLVSLAFGAMDLTLLLGLRDSAWRVYLLPYSTLFISLVMGAVLVDAFARARVRQDQINRELDARLAVRERQLGEQHEALLRLETERATAHERQRILRDMHDGLGSQLISSIHLVEGGTLEPAGVAMLLRECVDDLRLAIDSLKPAGNDLLVVLGNFRYRMEPRLSNAGVRLEWMVRPEARSPELSAEQVLHALRIVQEAVTNALKHARPSRLRIRFRDGAGTGGWSLSVEDDGIGIAARPEQEGGDGLRNMRSRAEQARLDLEIEGLEAGTKVTIGAGMRAAP
ncbi:MAG: sensor histidine kinase [Steroidobacteraceae bacterium]